MGEIVVGVDASPNGAAALRWALAEANLRNTVLTAVYAWGHLPPGHAGGGHVFEPEYGPEEADADLVAAIGEAVGSAPVAEIDRRLVYDTPAKALLAAAGQADLLVVGARGIGGFRGLLLGSVSEACLHHPPCPLAIVRDVPVADEAGRIVVGVDGSGCSRRALHWALDEARRRGAAVDVVHAWQPLSLAFSPFTSVHPDDSIIEKAAREVLDRTTDAVDTRRQPAPVERLLVRGSPARAVLDTALGADMVVLGTRGHGGFAGLLLGSVTHHVAHHVRCPLVVVP